MRGHGLFEGVSVPYVLYLLLSVVAVVALLSGTVVPGHQSGISYRGVMHRLNFQSDKICNQRLC